MMRVVKNGVVDEDHLLLELPTPIVRRANLAIKSNIFCVALLFNGMTREMREGSH